MAVAPDAIDRVESIVKLTLCHSTMVRSRLRRPHCLTVTGRVSPRVKERFLCVDPGRSDLCFATTNRQSSLRYGRALRCDCRHRLCQFVEATALASRNRCRLSACCPSKHRRRAPDDLQVLLASLGPLPQNSWFEKCSNASPPPGVELVRVTEEDEYFPPPRNIRELQAAINLQQQFFSEVVC